MAPDSISVVIPAFNAEPYLREAIGSVFGQTLPPSQVIVVDDGSSDATALIAAEDPRVTTVRQENRGIGGARNAGAARATGELIAFLDADDVWEPNALELLFGASEGVDAVFGAVIQFGEGREDSLPAVAYLAGSALIRKHAFDRVGAFREDVKMGEFIDWWARWTELGLKSGTIDDVVLRRRIHTTNTGITEAASRVDYTRVLRAALERRRQQ